MSGMLESIQTVFRKKFAFRKKKPLKISCGLAMNDPRVQYWEAAKYTAKLREMKTDKNLLLLHTQMDQGHLGASGRYESIREIAFEYAFVLSQLAR